ncbi:MAG TPA: serine hydrolase [Thermoanaerobaculia bacterium]|jgi:CubicO group peptidase (beta-lactamase class C family)|nr:serine hydrolase [Thermoanaerobaculia bacterium]
MLSLRLVLLATFLVVPPLFAVEPSPFPPNVDAYLAKALRDWEIPGMAVAVVHHGRISAQGYGVRELGRPEPVDVHTVFDSASLTKSFTSTLVATLVDEGKMKWDEPVRSYLPALALGDPYVTEHATVRDFLSHRTGLAATNSLWKLTALSRSEVMSRLRCLRQAAPFRSALVYSNLGYMVVGEAAAAAGGASWEELVRRRLLEPLKLSDTVASYEEGMTRPNHASSHSLIGGAQRPLHRETQREPIAAAGSVLSSAADLARWAALHLGGGELEGKSFGAESLAETHSPQVVIATTPEMRSARQVEFFAAYGMGWNVMDYRGHSMLWHSGSGDGQMAYMALLPKDDLAVVVLVNTWAADHVHGALASWLLDVYLGLEPRDSSGEALARHRSELAKGNEVQALLASAAAAVDPPRPLASYAATYESCPWGPIHVRVENGGLVLQMDKGEVADLRYHHGDSFVAVWRDPLYREDRTTLVELSAADGKRKLRMSVFRDDIEAVAPLDGR